MKQGVALLALVLALPSAAAAAIVERVPVPPKTSLYFAKQGTSSADYFELRKDGKYRQIDVQHLFTEEWDHGRWKGRGSDIFLHSRLRPVDIVTREFRIYVIDRAALKHLPRLRDKLAAFLGANSGSYIPFDAIKKIAVEVPKTKRTLGIDLTISFEFDTKRKAAKREALQALLVTIDEYLRRRDVFTHHFRLLRYRGVEWLEPLLPNDATPGPVSYIVERIDETGGKAPDLIFVRVSQREFAQGAGSLFPFKYYPEMNEKVRALQPKQ